MKRVQSITRRTLIPLSLVLMLGKPTASLIWNAASAFTELRSMKPQMDRFERRIDSLTERTGHVEISQAVMLQEIHDMRAPVFHTHSELHRFHKEFAQTSQGTGVPFFKGPLTMSGR